jgi:hypothetical protein
MTAMARSNGLTGVDAVRDKEGANGAFSGRGAAGTCSVLEWKSLHASGAEPLS